MPKRSVEDRLFVVQGMDVGVEFVRKLRAEMKKLGLSDDCFHRLVTPQGDIVVTDMAKVMQKAWGLPAYDITVDYSLTVEQMVAAVDCDWHNNNINTQNFNQEIIAEKGVREELKVVLLHLDRVVTSEEVFAEMEWLGLRPATLAELLAFGAFHTEMQREFQIVALGSSCTLHGYRQVVFLWGSSLERVLRLGDFAYHWLEYCRFLAVSK